MHEVHSLLFDPVEEQQNGPNLKSTNAAVARPVRRNWIKLGCTGLDYGKRSSLNLRIFFLKRISMYFLRFVKKYFFKLLMYLEQLQ